MCWLREIMSEKNNVQEGVDNMENGNGEGKRDYKNNWFLIVGLLTYSITLILKHTVGLPEFFVGFGQGFAIMAMFIGTLASAGKSVCGWKKFRRKAAKCDMR